MNLIKKKEGLIELLNGYIAGNIPCLQLQSFAWEVIDYFSSSDILELPIRQPWEREFWFSIWQITHLADHEHEKNGLTKRELEKALSYLKGETQMPSSYIGERP